MRVAQGNHVERIAQPRARRLLEGRRDAQVIRLHAQQPRDERAVRAVAAPRLGKRAVEVDFCLRDRLAEQCPRHRADAGRARCVGAGRADHHRPENVKNVHLSLLLQPMRRTVPPLYQVPRRKATGVRGVHTFIILYSCGWESACPVSGLPFPVGKRGIGRTVPKFCIGSGANAATILHFMPLAKSSKRVGPTITNSNVLGALRMSRNLGFRCIFAYFPGYQKLTRRRHPPAHSKRGQATPCPLFKIPHS